MNLTDTVHNLTADFFAGDRFKYAVDATLGNGRDALFLSTLIDDGGKVFAFDVQEQAIEESKRLFESERCLEKLEAFHAGHERMAELLSPDLRGAVSCVFFNLGWLPNSDKKCVTKKSTTLHALEQSLGFLDKSRSVLSVLCYRGHKGGTDEYLAVKEFFETELADAFDVYTDLRNDKSPVLFFAKFLKKSV